MMALQEGTGLDTILDMQYAIYVFSSSIKKKPPFTNTWVHQKGRSSNWVALIRNIYLQRGQAVGQGRILGFQGLILARHVVFL